MPYYILKYKEDSADYLEKIELPKIHQNYSKDGALGRTITSTAMCKICFLVRRKITLRKFGKAWKQSI
jgi:hypothetical protein